ncbi:MAG: hypothetical protein SLAVMIC_00852 [uncultured marine phage]|uniref:Uncharacterized protein n=1 Tax=uncultured marine phage TaxID=707152 RepID=A0A8D9FRF6_9VIRU|nr:MAG: hypothetical protein SLAVMIC_00852 [uncultured marine phage]
MSSNNVNIRVIEEQSEELHPCELSEDEIDAFLFKHDRKLHKKKMEQKRQPKPHQKRMNGDSDSQKSNQEYYDTKYTEVDAGDETVNFKIEIKSDMKI